MNKKMLSAPFLFWSALFIIIPICMVFYYGLTDQNGAFTLENIMAITTPEHSKALWEALKLSVISTIICLLLAYPLAIILCNLNVNQSSYIVMIFILPMWMNFLLRWKNVKAFVFSPLGVWKSTGIICPWAPTSTSSGTLRPGRRSWKR